MKEPVTVRPLIHKTTEPPPPAPTPKKKVSSETVKTLKVVFAIIGLLVGGVLIAWNLGLIFEEKPPPAPERPTGQGPTEAPARP